MTLQSRSEPSSDLAIMLSHSPNDITCATMNQVLVAWNIKSWLICITTVSEIKIELQAQMNTRLLLFPDELGMSNLEHLKIWNPVCISIFLERLLNPMVITYSPYYFVYKDILNASSNHLWCILKYFMWIDVMLYSWISVNYKNTIFKQNFRKFDYLISIFKWLSVAMATSHWPFKWSVFWIYIVCVFLWCMGNTYAIILNLY